MKKGVIYIGALFVTILMISTATAVPTTHSKPVMDVINTIEKQDEKFEPSNVPIGILNLIWQILVALFNLVMKIAEVVSIVASIIQLVQALVNGLQTVIQMLQNVIDLINDLFNPEEVSI